MIGNNPYPIGLDIGDCSITATQLRRGRGGPSLHAWARIRRLRPGGAPTADEAVRIREVLLRRGFEGRDVVLAAPESLLAMTVLEAPRRGSNTPAPSEAVARADLARTLGRNPVKLEVACWNVSVPDGPQHMLGVACDPGDCAPLLDSLDSAGFFPISLTPRAFALAAAFQAVAAACPDGLVIVDCGEDSALTVVVRAGGVAYTRNDAGGGLESFITNVSRRLGAEPAIVAALLKPSAQSGTPPQQPEIDPRRRRVQALAAEHFKRIAAGAAAAARFALGRQGAPRPSLALITGAGSRAVGAVDAMTDALGQVSRVASIRDTAVVGDPLNCDDPALLCSVGLSFLGGAGA